MRTLYFILQGRVKGFLPIFFYIVGVFIFFQNTGKAQGVDLKVVNYVEMLEGHTLSTQNGLLIPPNREIVYVVEVRNATSTSETFSNVTIEIAIPYYAEVYAYDSVDYYHGTKETSLSYSNKVITWKFTDVPGTQHQDTILAKLVYTLVSSNDCYALRNKCDKEIAVEGKYSGEGSDLGTFSDEPLAYGYHGSSSSNPVVVTFNAALVTSFLSKYCDGKDYREYVYLEGSTNIPVSDISDDFPAGAKFYDEINETTGVPTEPDLTLTGFPSTPARNEYYAWSSNTCWQKFYINVLDTTGIVYCAGEKMNDVVAWTEDWEEFNTTAISSGWYLGTEYIPDLSQRTLTLSDSSKKLTYKAEHVCEKDVVTSENEVEIIVYDKPEIVEFLEDSVYCAGEFLHMDMVMKANIYKDSTITYQWTFNGNVISTKSFVVTTDYAQLTTADSGKYLTVYITNSCGTTADSVLIKVQALPEVTITGAADICEKGTVTLIGNESGLPHTGGVWRSDDEAKATVTDGVVTGVSYGTVKIWYIITGGNGCKDSNDVDITVKKLPVVTIVGGADICEEATVQLTGQESGITHTSGTWRSDNEAIATVDNDGLVTGVSYGTVKIWYIITGSNGCKDSNDVDIIVKKLPVVTIVGGADICEEATVQLTGQESGSTHTGGVWRSDNEAIATVDEDGLVTGVSYGTVKIWYIITGSNGCKDSNEVTITVNPLPEVKINGKSTPDPIAICSTKTTSLTGLPTLGTGISKVEWKSLDPTKATVGSTTGLVTGISAGATTIRYIVTNNNDCIDSNEVTITVNPLPVVTIKGESNPAPIAICSTKTTSLTGSPVLGGSIKSVEWKSLDPTKATVGSTTGLVTGVSAGIVTIRYIVTNNNDCIDSNEVTITVNSLPDVKIDNPTAICEEGGTTTLVGRDDQTIPVQGQYSWEWKSTTPLIATVDASSGLVTGVSAGTATIRYILTNGNGCTDSADIDVIVNSLPDVKIDNPTAICEEGGTTTLVGRDGQTIPVQGQYSWEWKSTTPLIATIDASSGLVTGVLAGTAKIRYILTNANGCTDSADINVTVNSLPDVKINGKSTPDPIAICSTKTTQLTGTPVKGGDITDVEWKSLDPTKATVSATGLVTGLSAVPSVTIRYIVTNDNGCIDSNEVSIEVYALPDVNITGESDICEQGGTVTLTGQESGLPHTTGTWRSENDAIATVVKDMNGRGVVTGVSAGTAKIWYIVTNSNNCTDSNWVEFEIKPLPVVAITGPNSICYGTTTQLSPTTGGTWVSNNSSIATVDNAGRVTAGTFDGTATFTFTSTTTGCSNTTEVVTVSNFPIVADITGERNTFCIDTVIELSCPTLSGVWKLSNSNAVIEGNINDNPVKIKGKLEGKTFVSYTVGTGVCKTTVTHRIKVVEESTPPRIIIGIER